MLSGFEEYTEPLTDKEQQLLSLFIKGFATKHGKQNAITNKEIIQKLKDTRELAINETTVRKIINHIRRNNLVPGLVASNRGYWISNDPKEVKEYVQSLYSRANEIKSIADCMKTYLNILYGTQHSNNNQ